ncbi:hypothetical protein Ciccas_006255 [Cichlidogyrus casuarinus]|uniref:Uncharacterized protein n=1 Tax=Cichlidogyrus casuarinus TaxID=1844966 RepID=A0ABD2Q6B8_9PLAT
MEVEFNELSIEIESDPRREEADLARHLAGIPIHEGTVYPDDAARYDPTDGFELYTCEEVAFSDVIEQQESESMALLDELEKLKKQKFILQCQEEALKRIEHTKPLSHWHENKHYRIET